MLKIEDDTLHSHSEPQARAAVKPGKITSPSWEEGFVAGEGVQFSVTNTPVPTTDDYTLCIRYTVDAQ